MKRSGAFWVFYDRLILWLFKKKFYKTIIKPEVLLVLKYLGNKVPRKQGESSIIKKG